MTESIIIALISGGVTLIGAVLSFIATSKKLQKESEKAQQEQIDSLRKDINKKLDDHRSEYLHEIGDVKQKITDTKIEYEKTVIKITGQIDNLTEKVNRHNNLVERMYAVEQATAVQTEQIKVANHRIEDLENKNASNKKAD